MTRNEVFDYIRDTFGVEPDFPFDEDFVSAVARHPENKKWFALLMRIPADKLGHDYSDEIDILTIKSDPLLIDSLVENDEGFHRAYHMNKRQWLTIELKENFADEDIQYLLGLSYKLTNRKKTNGSS
ncbi:MAG: MmcQ/YjbR family DNA-binding protein [Oscillospiraceae bacterium]|nr:MmcQ/YjbR family DNA-binding protein [Ruminococcus sp.]MCD8345900.1 MmcQ/YjbR family DNA-binding protein [Oscillospiraceae bacterium]